MILRLFEFLIFFLILQNFGPGPLFRVSLLPFFREQKQMHRKIHRIEYDYFSISFSTAVMDLPLPRSLESRFVIAVVVGIVILAIVDLFGPTRACVHA